MSSTGPDIASVVTELTSITGLQLQVVSGPADIEVAWGEIPIHSVIGEARLATEATTIMHVSVTIARRGGAVLATLLRHEMAHALGVGHAQEADEVMYPTFAEGAPTDFQAGDLAALHAVGIQQSVC